MITRPAGRGVSGRAQFGRDRRLTCYQMPNSTARLCCDIRSRHTYGTTGNALLLDVQARLPAGSVRYSDDPKLGPAPSRPRQRR